MIAPPADLASTAKSLGTTHVPVYHEIFNAAFAIAEMITWFANVHQRRKKEGEATSRFTVDPLAFFVATGQYYSLILGSRPISEPHPLHARIERRKLQILNKWLYRSDGRMKSGEFSREMWFWQAFCGLLGNEILLARHAPYQVAMIRSECNEPKSWLAGRIRMWARVTGVTTWSEAQATLQSIAWPEVFQHQTLAETTWYQVLEQGY
jgi:hypothetical protein